MLKTLKFNKMIAIMLTFTFLLSNIAFAQMNNYEGEKVFANNGSKAGGYEETLDGFTMSGWAEKEVKKSIDMNIFFKGLDKNLKEPINREDFAVISVLTLEGNYVLPKGEKIPSSFVDIDKNSDTYAYVNKAKHYKLVNGVSATQFAPNRNIKRKEALVMLYRIYKNYEKAKYKVTSPEQVKDFKASDDYKNLESWAKDAVLYFVGAGIFKGYGNGKYGLNDKINNEQALVLSTRYVDYLRALPGATASAIKKEPATNNSQVNKPKPSNSQGEIAQAGNPTASKPGQRMYNGVAFSQSEYNEMMDYLDFVRNHPIKNDYKVYSTMPSQSGANGQVGVLNNDTRTDFLNSINRFRKAAKVPLVQLNEKLMGDAQHCAYLMKVTNQYSHYLKRKGADANLHARGADAALKSNIGYNTSTYANVYWFVESCTMDNTTKNIPKLGHRRWNINPNMKYTGIGVAKPYFAQYAFDTSRSPQVSPDFVAYPSKGAFPYELLKDAPWSIELGIPYSGGEKKYKINPAKTLKVTLTRLSDNRQEVFAQKASAYTGGKFFNVNEEGFGYGNAIIFKPTMTIRALERYRVRVDNILDATKNRETFIEYEVIFF